MPQANRIPLLMIGDDPALPTGLARIALATKRRPKG
jgi:hypothetical protein